MIRVLETPGHTDYHLAFVLHDPAYPDGPVGVFTGDALFVGDVGRTDFYPDRKREVAGLLFDSPQKILAPGDQDILSPAHGAGLGVGSGWAEHELDRRRGREGEGGSVGRELGGAGITKK